MALTKQTKFARKRMNLIRSAQQRMFLAIEIHAHKKCPVVFDPLFGGGKRDHAPKQLVLFCSDLKFPFTHWSS